MIASLVALERASAKGKGSLLSLLFLFSFLLNNASCQKGCLPLSDGLRQRKGSGDRRAQHPPLLVDPDRGPIKAPVASENASDADDGGGKRIRLSTGLSDFGGFTITLDGTVGGRSEGDECSDELREDHSRDKPQKQSGIWPERLEEPSGRVRDVQDASRD